MASRSRTSEKIVGILALQGDFDAHRKVLDACGMASRLVREARDLNECDALILPGGESTAMARGCDRLGLWEPLRQRLQEGMPALGTCAGLILLARDIEGGATTFAQKTLGVLDVSVARNAYGAQIESFETQVPVRGMVGEAARAAFIRAPQITRVGSGVEVLAEYEGKPVLVRQTTVAGSPIWGCAFHPEIAGEIRLHQQWLNEF